MEKQERIKLTLRGEPADRLPYSFWTHLPDCDLDAAKLAEATSAFCKELDLDFIKSMPNGMYSIQDWGCECDFSQIPKGGVARIVKAGVEQPRDWTRLELNDPRAGAMGRELSSLDQLIKLTKRQVPVLATVFSPATTANKLSKGAFLEHIKSDPELAKQGLEVITQTTCELVRAAMEIGCAGIFLASQISTDAVMTTDEYAEFGIPYDLAVLDAIKDSSWFNVLHLHGEQVMFDLLKDYPVHGFSWHIWETPPDPGAFMEKTKDKVIVGGLQRNNISTGRLDLLVQDMENTLSQTGGKRLILTPGCTIRHPVEKKIINYLVACLRDYEKRMAC